MYMRQMWKDTRLAFGNRSSTLVLQYEAINKMWLPDTFFENAVETSVQQETRTIVLYGDGWIFFTQRYKLGVAARVGDYRGLRFII